MTFARHIPDDSGRIHRYLPVVENRPASLHANRLRVIAFNAQGGRKFNDILQCFAHEPLRSADIVLLSEVDIGTRRSGGRKVASELARELGMSCAYVPEFGLMGPDGTIRAYLGNAILARVPMKDVRAIPLPRVSVRIPGIPRSLGPVRREGAQVAIVASVEVRGNPVYLSVAHLDSRAHPSGRDHQVSMMLEGFPADGRMIFGGDLNTTTVDLSEPKSARRVVGQMMFHGKRFRDPFAYEPLLARLTAAGFELGGANSHGRPTFTFIRAIPPWMRPKLDWIALRGLSPVDGSAKVIPARPSFFSARVSDHDFIAVDVAI